MLIVMLLYYFYCQNACASIFLSLTVWFTISVPHRIRANQVAKEFDFTIERIFIKIARGSTLGFIVWGLIGTCPSVSNHVYTWIMLIKQKIIFVFSSSTVSQRNKWVVRKIVFPHWFRTICVGFLYILFWKKEVLMFIF